MWIITASETDKDDLVWQVGYYAPGAFFVPVFSYHSVTAAAMQTHYLNGGELSDVDIHFIAKLEVERDLR